MQRKGKLSGAGRKGLKQNTDAARNIRRTARNLMWNTWTATTPSDNITTAVECVEGVIMQQITLTTQPAGIVNNSVYRLTPKINENSSLDIAGGTSGSLAGIWDWHSGENQKFQIVSLGYGYYRLVPQHNTGTSLDVTGGSAANNIAIEIWTSNPVNGC